MQLRSILAAVPTPDLVRSPAVDAGIADSVADLASDAALRSLEVDIYWPKWSSPWWHMLVLHELGEARQIPSPAVAAMVDGLDRLPLHSFPITDDELAPGTDPARDSTCHCALGCMAQVLSACGVELDRALPWVGPWFVRYQMADGGLNCDHLAYRETAECPSSMVATIAPFEAMLVTGSQRDFVDRAAHFLLARRLSDGSSTVHNADERRSAPGWRLPCFPRFYFYDRLRGLAAVVRWAETRGQRLPSAAVADVVTDLVEQFPDGVVSVGRRAHDGRTTLMPTPDRSPSTRQPASSSPLLDAVSVVGAPSEALTRQWSAARDGLLRLIDAGQLGD